MTTFLRILLIPILTVCGAGVANSAPDVPPFPGTAYISPNVITDDDPSAFVSLTYVGSGRRNMFDRRTNSFANRSAYLFMAKFQDGSRIEMQVNTEFDRREARVVAAKYATYIGKLPTLLRTDVDTAWIHKGDYPFGGGNRNILIHTDHAAVLESAHFAGGSGNYVEEVLIHEAAHTSLDQYHAKAAGWLNAQAKDPTFISTYARDNPVREDIAESFLPYLLVRHRAERVPASVVDTINEAIPHRLGYFDQRVGESDWCPIVPDDCP